MSFSIRVKEIVAFLQNGTRKSAEQLDAMLNKGGDFPKSLGMFYMFYIFLVVYLIILDEITGLSIVCFLTPETMVQFPSSVPSHNLFIIYIYICRGFGIAPSNLPGFRSTKSS